MITTAQPRYTAYPVSVTEECAPNGSGQCDGYSDDSEACECECHGTILDDATVNHVRLWHKEMYIDAKEMQANGY